MTKLLAEEKTNEQIKKNTQRLDLSRYDSSNSNYHLRDTSFLVNLIKKQYRTSLTDPRR